MQLKKFKERDHKRIGIIVFTIAGILLVSGVILYRTFAIFEVKTNQNVINGTVQDPGNIYFAFYVDNEIQKEMPTKNYVLDEDNSYCGINGNDDPNIKVSLTEDYTVHVSGMTSSRTKCNLYFVSGTFILGKPIKATSNDAGLYETTHEDVSGTLNDDGFKQTEFRYAGSSPNNYVEFNNEPWRIIGLVNVLTDENTVEQRVKIIRNEPIINVAYNNLKVMNDWGTSSLKELLNGEDTIKNNNEMIEEVIWTIGGHDNHSIVSNELYNYERTKVITQTNIYTWRGNVAIMYPSDYGYAVGGDRRQECILEKKLANYNECVQESWITSDSFEWFLFYTTDIAYEGNYVYELNPNGQVHRIYHNVSTVNNQQARPVIYLKSNVKILNDGQDGSEGKPYHLQQIF